MHAMGGTNSPPGRFVRTYLAAYNAAQAALWAACAVALAAAVARGEGFSEAFNSASPFARWAQSAAFVEILHAAAGLVHSSPVTNFWQWLARANALFKFAVGIPELQQHPCAALMLAVWSLGEVIRYPWYTLTLLGACPAWLTWLRYTAFLLLYPIGAVSEMLLLYSGVPLVRARGLYSISLPNSWNWAWDYALFIQVMLLAYPYLWWGNYSSLLRQRGKKLRVQPESRGEAAAVGGHSANGGGDKRD